MISYQSNYFEVFIIMSQVHIELSPPGENGGGGGEIAQLRQWGRGVRLLN